MEQLIQILSTFLINYIEILSFLSPILGGENGVIFVSFLASSNFLTLLNVFIFAFLGMLTIDSFWFFITKTKLYNRMVNGKRVSNNYKKIEKRLEKLSHGKDILILMLSKILVGTRILVIIFIGARKMKYPKFLAVILIPNFVWTAALVFIGYLARGGYDSTIRTFENIQLGILFIIIFIFLFYYLIKRFNKWIMEK